jgi:hypothetical protein
MLLEKPESFLEPKSLELPKAAEPRHRQVTKPRHRLATKPRHRLATKPRHRLATKPRHRLATKPRHPERAQRAEGSHHRHQILRYAQDDTLRSGR